MNDPKYCPFCGNEHAEVIGEEGGTWGVYCDFCNASVEGYVSKEAAIRSWNHRFKPDKEEAER